MSLTFMHTRVLCIHVGPKSLSNGHREKMGLTSSSLCCWVRALSLRCRWLDFFWSASFACSSASLAAAAAPAAVFFLSPIYRWRTTRSGPHGPSAAFCSAVQ